MGSEVVLTADRTLMSEYGGSIFVGFAACAPKLIPDFLYRRFLCPPIEAKDGSPAAAPDGLRKMEAALSRAGVDVKVAHPDHLSEVVDDGTRVVGITSNDPRGLGPASSTFGSLVGRKTFSAVFFERTVKEVRQVLDSHKGGKIVVGGPGAWQLESEEVLNQYGIDHVVIGEGEITGVDLIKRILRGEPAPRIAYGEMVPLEQIPSILHRTVGGIVEIARRCGRGCEFCLPNLRFLRSRPIPQIVEEVQVNLREGAEGVCLHAEDVFRYGAQGVIPDKERVIRLFTEVLKHTPNVGVSHAAFASVAAKPDLVHRLTELLDDAGGDAPWYSAQMGIETASPHLVRKYMPGKPLPFKIEEWPEVVIHAHEILAENRWVPASTLIAGLPGETAEDVERTIELVERLREFKSLIVPLFFVPIGTLTEEKFFLKENMQPEHWRLLAACMEHNFYWVDELAEEHLRNRVQRFFVKQVVFKMFRWKLKEPLELMKEGLDPTKAEKELVLNQPPESEAVTAQH